MLKESRKGNQLYLGEDAYPYADKDMLIVADGLGGRGGFPHTKFNRDILEEDKLYETIFAPVFDEVDEEFKSFVINSFKELYLTKDYYFDDMRATKCSGYFASRIVVAVVLYNLKYNEKFKKSKIFESYNDASDEDERDLIAQAYGDKLAEIVKETVAKIVENVGFELESKVKGAYLLPSTLTVAITDEHEDCVDVLYLWAGDSRGYKWDKSGLGQITEDHERDEAMTNIISQTAPFRIEGRFVSVAKPCLLFNTSDGCYKCPVFASPFDMEYLFLMAFDSGNSFEDASKFLSEQLKVIGIHDDSNTMALSSFGYEDYGAVKNAVKERLEDINDTIVARLPGILERDYPGELEAIKSAASRVDVVDFCDELIAIDGVKACIIEKMKSEYEPYQVALQQAKDKLDENCTSAIIDELKSWIGTNWLEGERLLQKSSRKDNFLRKKNPFGMLLECYEVMNIARKDHEGNVDGFSDAVDSINEALKQQLKRLEDIDSLDLADMTKINEAKAQFETFNQIMKKIEKVAGRYVVYNKARKKLIAEYLERDEKVIEAMAKDILNSKLKLRVADKSTNEYIDGLCQRYTESKTEYEESLANAVSELEQTQLKSYWKKNLRALCRYIWDENRELLPSDLAEKISKHLDVDMSGVAELEECCRIREEIYREYEIAYKVLYRSSRI